MQHSDIYGVIATLTLVLGAHSSGARYFTIYEIDRLG